MTAKTTTAPSYRLRAVFAAEKLHRAALDAGDDAKAATVLEVTRLFIPNARFSESAKPATRLPAKVEATEQPTDLSEDEHDYRAYMDQIDGSAIRRRAEEEARENEAITARHYAENPEARPTNWTSTD